jgi:UDP-GlcNAc:undecaprenyl-phosphate GlcNAc-1-phosphate transferase
MSSWKTLIFGLFAIMWGFGATGLSVQLSRRYRIVDPSGSARKIHEGEVPRGGGVALWLGVLLSILLQPEASSFSASLAFGSSFIFIVGYIDDMRSLPPFLRLIVHLTSACIVVYAIPAPIALLERAILVFWVTGMTSAFNLIDGLNGLLLSIFAASAVLALIWTDQWAWVPLLGMALGALWWNFPEARTFLGDGGSTLLGFLYASLISNYVASRGVSSALAVLAVVAILGGIPLIDTLTSIVRRLAEHRSPFSPDRGHIHHRLIDSGLSCGAAVATLVGLHVLCIACGFVLLNHIAG